MPKIMDLILLIHSVFIYWATSLGTVKVQAGRAVLTLCFGGSLHPKLSGCRPQNAI